MDNKMMMENLLSSTKTMISLYEHASVEASTPKIHEEFKTLLNDALELQHEIYTAMSEEGWYKMEKAETKQITKTISKYAVH